MMKREEGRRKREEGRSWVKPDLRIVSVNS
jgi:hypothetical protein